MEKHTARKYSSPIRERQANQTRTNILDATQRLFLERGYAKTTVEAIAQEAGVAKQTVYAVFRSKNGIVAELLDRAVFTERVFELHDRSLETANIHEALKLTAQLVLQVHESQSPVFDLLRGAGMLDPQLARVQNDLRCVNRDRQENHVRFLLRGRRLKEGIDMGMALDVLRHHATYRMLAERGLETYANWLYEMLANSLLHVSEEHPGEGWEMRTEEHLSAQR
ncbi:MAG: TetR/AcrR family transcriptional regulator [Bilophila wadsworthia]